jgi:hypothetical protein
MGFQDADIQPLVDNVSSLSGVSGVRLLLDPDGVHTMSVAVKGLSDQSHLNRRRVREVIEDFIKSHETDMGQSGFAFDYHLTVDEEALSSAQAAIPTAVE